MASSSSTYDFETADPTFAKLLAHLRMLGSLEYATNILYWDQQTYLPDAAVESRGFHLATLTRMHHELATRDDLGTRLESLAPLTSDLSDNANALVREAKKEFDRLQRIPTDLSVRMAETASKSYALWKQARAEESFDVVRSIMERNLDLSREYAECLKQPHHQSLMDPLIELSDEGMSEAELRPLFDELRTKLVPLIEQVAATNSSCLLQKYPEMDQRAFGEQVIRQLGFDFRRGRQDKTEHPFMIRFAHSDVRITTRFKENDLSDGLFSTIHEAGHALYELGIDERYDGTPLGQGSSSGIHESQSRLWENLVGRSRPFWEHFYPRLQNIFPAQLGSVSLNDFYLAINRVEKSRIRTDADELTYNLHVMIRFDLEADLLAGRLKIRDLPEAWNARYKSDLGLTPDRPSVGVLQDVHWYGGRIGGGFQGYTIGNILSAQLFAAAKRAIPNLTEQFQKGEFENLREWLRTNLHQFGRKYPPTELIERATGSALSTHEYLDYLNEKFRAPEFQELAYTR